MNKGRIQRVRGTIPLATLVAMAVVVSVAEVSAGAVMTRACEPTNALRVREQQVMVKLLGQLTDAAKRFQGLSDRAALAERHDLSPAAHPSSTPLIALTRELPSFLAQNVAQHRLALPPPGV